ncbi:hypothetical protein [Winogradskyella thalassocola]|uniref:Uncharacterized protein n=1 Tax=Winogradskyella thalassocola TaxID=262004 RepID=A0A1G7WBR6_9FLAO|nr:hypothetical protein [Winogradskyella thalassocola]SDG69408.1 hypothetical protein SAMN04489796_101311 [Winogradskyella thalassocola]
MTNNKYQIAIEALKEREQELNKELESLRISINSLLNSSSYSGTLFDNISMVNESNNESNNEFSKSSKVISNKKSSNSKKSFKPEFNINSTVLDIINRNERFMHFREIASVMIKEKGIEDIDSSNLARELSIKTLSVKKKGLLVKYKFGNEARNTFWGKKDWLDRNGGIIKGFEYNTNYISGNYNPDNCSEKELYG